MNTKVVLNSSESVRKTALQAAANTRATDEHSLALFDLHPLSPAHVRIHRRGTGVLVAEDRLRFGPLIPEHPLSQRPNFSEQSIISMARVGIGLSHGVWAAEVDAWQYEATPYFLAAGPYGTFGVRGVEADMDM